MSAQPSEKPTTIYGAIASNLVIAIAKFTGGIITGSSAMLSEGIHSIVDTGNELLLLLGVRRSQLPPDEMHPFGHGKERYFWGLIVSIILFGVGGGMSVYEGITHLEHPTEITDPTWNYVILGIGFVAEGISWVIAYRKLHKQKREDESIFETLHDSKDPAVFNVLGEDTAALLGLTVAFLGIYLGHRFQNPYYDGAASIVIGLILILVAGYLAYETRNLLIGESASPEVISDIRRVVEEDPDVVSVIRLLTMHFGPEQILLNLDLKFDPKISGEELTQTIARLEERIREVRPEVRTIFIESHALSERSLSS